MKQIDTDLLRRMLIM